MRVTIWGAARQEDQRYCALKVSGVNASFAPRAVFSFDDARMGVPLYCIEGAGTARQIWVVAFPYLTTANQSLELAFENGPTIWRKRFSSRSFDLMNSLTCRVRPSLIPLMLGIELRHASQSAFIEVLTTYPYDENYELTHIRVNYPKGVHNVTLNPHDVLANAVAKDAYVLECGTGDDGCHHITLSYLLPKDTGELYFSTPGGPGYLPWVFHFSPNLRSNMVQDFAKMVCDAAGDDRYPSWFKAHRTSEDKLVAQRSHHFDYEPLMSIVVPLYQPPMEFLKDCIESIRAQTYARWELVAAYAAPHDQAVSAYLSEISATDTRIKVVTLPENLRIVGNTNEGIRAATGDYVCFMDQDDIIEPDALFEYVRLINEQTDLGMLYCDEDSFSGDLEGVFYPRFKPNYNPDALYAHNYIIHMLCARRDLLFEVGLSEPAVEGAQDYDLTLKLSEAAPVGHVPRVLYHWRNHQKSINYAANESKPYVTNAAVTALQAHFDRTGIKATVAPGARPGTHSVSYEVEGDPMVSIIIPTKDHIELLEPCVTSLLDKAGWDKLEILLVENNSCDSATFAFYDKLVASDNRIHLLRYEGTFNYSKIVNFAARKAKGEYLYILNNDTVALTDNLIRTLVGQAQQPGVGVVGPLLLFPDGLVQTAGLALMADGRLGFINQFLTLATHGGYLASMECPRAYSAVLGAAQMVSKEVFDEVGGYDEELAVTYNDVDFCWRVRKTGKRVVYTPQAQMTHREFATRGHDAETPEKAARTEREAKLMRTRWAEYFANGDPELNPECDLASPWFKLPQ